VVKWVDFLAILRVVIIALYTLFWAVPVVILSYFDPYAQRAYRLVRFWVRGSLWFCRVKVRVQGRERLDPDRVYLFMANHQSQFDILAIAAALSDFQLRWVAKQELLRVPVFGLVLRVTKQIVVDRQNRAQAVTTLRQVRRLLDAGISVLFFPEGTRNSDSHLLPFKPGGFAVAIQKGVPVVPVIVKGSQQVLPAKSWRIRSGEIEVVLSPPLPVEEYAGKKQGREELMHKVRQAILAHLHPSSSLPADKEFSFSPRAL
jgi:1-acyl-sn-glycerol-3-phosphate acyltransferase